MMATTCHQIALAQNPNPHPDKPPDRCERNDHRMNSPKKRRNKGHRQCRKTGLCGVLMKTRRHPSAPEQGSKRKQNHWGPPQPSSSKKQQGQWSQRGKSKFPSFSVAHLANALAQKLHLQPTPFGSRRQAQAAPGNGRTKQLSRRQAQTFQPFQAVGRTVTGKTVATGRNQREVGRTMTGNKIGRAMTAGRKTAGRTLAGSKYQTAGVMTEAETVAATIVAKRPSSKQEAHKLQAESKTFYSTSLHLKFNLP